MNNPPSSKQQYSILTKLFQAMNKLTRYLSEDMWGGPKWLKLSWVVNFQKGGTLVYVLALILLYRDQTPAAWTYLGLHGTYGLCWLMKERYFPDPGWQVKVTWMGGLNAFLFVLGPYWIAPTLLITGMMGTQDINRPTWWLGLCIFIHTFGLALMIGSDAQKYFTLKLKRGLITNGFFSSMRHPNYTGEMMIYGSYALLVWHWLPALVLLFVWSCLFAPNIALKELSMSRYPQWQAYKAQTGYLLPKLTSPSPVSSSESL
jgi:protein-S-isoprenylcysteine O-methyltransferase Ste14